MSHHDIVIEICRGYHYCIKKYENELMFARIHQNKYMGMKMIKRCFMAVFRNGGEFHHLFILRVVCPSIEILCF